MLQVHALLLKLAGIWTTLLNCTVFDTRLKV